ncbi:uncharacterized protein IUM83_17905 [Phytophthora cinnamomi]|uniref:uncharacterized protein n=1 Tax=Phytophthora cinnamomi TaxID=4785 RepID=UPI003559BE01|nr:hypothetical protein IUM83_17905 [Phytophthora cinnamomi]
MGSVLASLVPGSATPALEDVDLGRGAGTYTAQGEWVLRSDPRRESRLTPTQMDMLAQQDERRLPEAERRRAINLAPQQRVPDWNSEMLLWFVQYGVLGKLGSETIADTTNLNRGTINTRASVARRVLKMHRERREGRS